MSLSKQCHSLFPQKPKSIHLRTGALQFTLKESRNTFYIIKSNVWLTCFNYRSLRVPKAGVHSGCGLWDSKALRWTILFQCRPAISILKFLGFRCSHTAFIGRCCVGRFGLALVLKDHATLYIKDSARYFSLQKSLQYLYIVPPIFKDFRWILIWI